MTTLCASIPFVQVKYLLIFFVMVKYSSVNRCDNTPIYDGKQLARDLADVEIKDIRVNVQCIIYALIIVLNLYEQQEGVLSTL